MYDKNSKICLLSGIDIKAPFLVVTIEAAAFANLAKFFICVCVRDSIPCYNKKSIIHPQNASPAPVVSIVFSCKYASCRISIFL